MATVVLEQLRAFDPQATQVEETTLLVVDDTVKNPNLVQASTQELVVEAQAKQTPFNG